MLVHVSMTTKERSALRKRDAILRLLTDDENAKTSRLEGQERLAHGEDYLDLDKLEIGVLKADGVMVDMGRILPRKAVREATWAAILKELTAH